MTNRRMLLGVGVASALAVLVAGAAFSAQDRYGVSVPGGLSFSEFRGYETWQVVSISNGGLLAVILGNPTTIAAYKAGIPANGKPFPDGAKLAKLQYIPKKSTEAPFDVSIPDHLKDVAFMVRDSKRFANTGSWGWALFDYDTAKDAYTPNGTGAACGFACHASVAKKDYVFTSYGRR